MNILKSSTRSRLQVSMQSSSTLPLVLPSSLSSCDLLPFHFCLFHVPSVSSCVHKLIFAFYSFPRSSCLCLVMLAPCRSSSMPSLTCLGAAVMKTLRRRRRRRILHGFNLGPGTPLHGVGVCVCVRLLSNVTAACSSGPGRLTTNCTPTHMGTVGKIYQGGHICMIRVWSGLGTRFHNSHVYWW